MTVRYLNIILKKIIFKVKNLEQIIAGNSSP